MSDESSTEASLGVSTRAKTENPVTSEEMSTSNITKTTSQSSTEVTNVITKNANVITDPGDTTTHFNDITTDINDITTDNDDITTRFSGVTTYFSTNQVASESDNKLSSADTSTLVTTALEEVSTEMSKQYGSTQPNLTTQEALTDKTPENITSDSNTELKTSVDSYTTSKADTTSFESKSTIANQTTEKTITISDNISTSPGSVPTQPVPITTHSLSNTSMYTGMPSNQDTKENDDDKLSLHLAYILIPFFIIAVAIVISVICLYR